MTNRQRVLAALNHAQPDKVPYCIGYTQRFREKMAARYPELASEDALGNALTSVGPAAPDAWREVAPDIWQDEFGVQWDRSVDKDIGVVVNRVVTPDNLAECPFPDPADPRRWARLPQTIAEKGDTFFIVNIGFSLYERAWTMTGMENLLIAMVTEPGFVHRLLDRILEYNLGIIERACAYDIDAMMFGDDWGSQYGLQMGPELWASVIKPRVREMYQAARRRGKYVFIHSCGKVDSLFPELIDCGLHCFNPFQPEVMDVFEMKRRYAGQLAFFGGISTQRTLPSATPAQVKEEVKRLIDVVGASGGYIAAPAHSVPPDAKPENVAAMLEVLRGQ